MERYHTLVSVIPDVLFCLDREGIIRYYKGATDTDSLLPLDVSPGEPLASVLPADVASTALQCARHALDSGSMHMVEYQLSSGTTVRDYETRFVTSGDDEVLAIVRDISTRKHAERLKNEFVSIVSHELRTPLTSIRGSLGLIIGSMADDMPPKARRLVEIAHKNSERLVSLVNDILDIDKIESGKMVFTLKPIALYPVIEQAIEMNRSYGEQLEVTFSLRGDVSGVLVHADSERLTQVVTNLLSNAAKFSPAGSEVTVQVERANEHVRVSVTDHGPGIPEAFQDRIFQKFAQADTTDTRQKSGTGLGLSISKAIIERHGGHIGFETQPGQTTFSFELPEWRQDSVSFDSKQHRHRILICEDTPDLASMLSLMLSHSGYETDIAYNTRQAKQFLANNQYAAMTLDIVMPGESGIDLIRELRSQERTRHLPIVVVSALAQQGREELAGGAFEVVDWLDKPVNHEHLIMAMQRAVSRRNVTTRPRILHIEDDMDVYHVVSTILNDVAETCRATSLHEARQRLEEETFDLIILDLSLPDGSGLDLIPLLNSPSRPPVPVMIFSAREVGHDAAQKVAAALVKSRTSNQELLEAIQSFIGETS